VICGLHDGGVEIKLRIDFDPFDERDYQVKGLVSIPTSASDCDDDATYVCAYVFLPNPKMPNEKLSTYIMPNCSKRYVGEFHLSDPKIYSKRYIGEFHLTDPKIYSKRYVGEFHLTDPFLPNFT
jgi:hypothetical protein